jgi:tetratricopeptide (TPR) repeat protein
MQKFWMVLAAGVLLSPMLFGCEGSPQENANQRMARARQEEKAGKTDAAILDYRRAIQYEPKSLEPREELAHVYIAHGEYLSAFQELNQILKLDPKNWSARMQMTTLYLEGHNFFQAEQQAQDLLKERPGDPAVLLVMAKSALGLKEYGLASSSADEVLKKDPHNPEAWLVRGLVQLAQSQTTAGQESLEKAIAYRADWMQPVAALAGSYMGQHQPAQAEKVIRAAVARSPNNIHGQYLLAALLLDENRQPEVEQVLAKISVLGENNPLDRSVLALYHAVIGNFALAESEYLAILKKYPADSVNRQELANVYIHQGKVPAARQLLEEGLKISPDDPELLLIRAQIDIDQGQLTQAIQDLQRVIQLRPNLPLPQFLLGLAQLREGKRGLAQNSLNSALNLDPQFLPARLVLAEMALGQGQPNAALSNMEEAIEQKPLIIQPYLLRSLALAEKGQTDRAEADLMPLLNRFAQPGAQELTYRTLSSLNLSQKRFGQAQRFAEKALQINPKSRPALYLLGVSEFGAKRVDHGLRDVEARVKADPDWAAGYEVLGRLLLMAGQPAKAETVLEKSIQLDPGLDSARMTLSQAQVAQNQLAQASATLQQILQKHPRSATAYIRLGQVAELQNNWQAAQKDYQTALEIEPRNPFAENNLAWIYAEHNGDLDLALKMAQSVKEAFPDNPNISDTLGWILVKKHNYITAIQILREAVKGNPQKALYEYHLGVAYYRASQKAQAKSALEKALELQSDFPEASNARQLLQLLEKPAPPPSRGRN